MLLIIAAAITARHIFMMSLSRYAGYAFARHYAMRER
jgi:hypothetical protein